MDGWVGTVLKIIVGLGVFGLIVWFVGTQTDLFKKTAKDTNQQQLTGFVNRTSAEHGP